MTARQPTLMGTVPQPGAIGAHHERHDRQHGRRASSSPTPRSIPSHVPSPARSPGRGVPARSPAVATTPAPPSCGPGPATGSGTSARIPTATHRDCPPRRRAEEDQPALRRALQGSRPAAARRGHGRQPARSAHGRGAGCERGSGACGPPATRRLTRGRGWRHPERHLARRAERRSTQELANLLRPLSGLGRPASKE